MQVSYLGGRKDSGYGLLECVEMGGALWVRKLGGLTQSRPHREGRRGSIQVDGEELVSGQSPGPNVAVNTKGSIYVGESWAGVSVPEGLLQIPAHAPLSSGAPGADRSCPLPPQAEPPTWPH